MAHWGWGVQKLNCACTNSEMILLNLCLPCSTAGTYKKEILLVAHMLTFTFSSSINHLSLP